MRLISETYAIINISDLGLIDFAQVGENSADTIRKSLDELQFVLKWDNEPTFISNGSVVPVSVLTYNECFELMQTPEWTADEDE